MATIKIESLGREIELLPYTRKVSRDYKNALLRGVEINTNQVIDPTKIEMTLPVTNQLEAEEILVKGITGLSNSEIDSILDEEYTALVEAVNKHVEGKKK